MKKILVPTDFSEQAENALKVAVQLAKKHGSEIYLLHMLEIPLQEIRDLATGGRAIKKAGKPDESTLFSRKCTSGRPWQQPDLSAEKDLKNLRSPPAKYARQTFAPVINQDLKSREPGLLPQSILLSGRNTRSDRE